VHLHPKWQQKVVTKLREVFPNIQFVVTTHSPLVVTNLPDENFKVYRLRDNGVEKFDKVRGMRLIEIFYNLYDTPERPLGIKEEIDKLFEAIDEDDEKTAHERLKELKKVLSEDDPAIIEAETSLKYMNV
jgi:predicted ATP-binding protein involved in virulence